MLFGVICYLIVQKNIFPNNHYVWNGSLLFVAIGCIALRGVVNTFLNFKRRIMKSYSK